jgi:hemerythrin-like domain-containing protein
VHAVSEPRAQHPIDEILAEHHLMRVVLHAMQVEALRLTKAKNFNFEFWSNAVDFVGNFGLLYHWRKKANHLYPVIDELGGGAPIAKLEDQQQRDIELTLELTDAAQDGDFEKLTRLVALLILVKREKMDAEERDVLLPSRATLSGAKADALRVSFDEVEKKALPERGRREYLDIARNLAKLAGLPDPAAD